MGGWGVSRVRRVGCGAVLLPVSSVAVSSASVIWCVWAARRSRARSPAVLTSRTSSPWLPLDAPCHPSPCLLVPACLPRPSAVTVVKQPRPLPSRVPAVPVAVTVARHSCKRCGARLYVVFLLPFARLREIRRGPPSPRLPPLHLSVVVLWRLRALPFPGPDVTCIYLSTVKFYL
jgi:hypothetical protein